MTYKKGTHKIQEIKRPLHLLYGGSSTRPAFYCIRCGKREITLLSREWKKESCVDYLARQYELRDISNNTNPVRLRNLENLTFDEVFNDCQDDVEYLERRSKTVDTPHGREPKDWGVQHVEEPQSRKTILEKIISMLS